MRSRSELFTQLYEQLHQLAQIRLLNENGGKDATSLVHEAYIKLRGWDTSFQNEEHFLAISTRVMRQILVDRARARLARKRYCKLEPLSISIDCVPQRGPNLIDILLLDALLNRLAGFDPRAAQITEMHIFLGLGEDDIATSLGISHRTVKRDWSAAKAWLKAELSSSKKEA